MKLLFDFFITFKCLIHFFIRLRLLRDNAKIEKLLIIIVENFRLLIALVS